MYFFPVLETSTSSSLIKIVCKCNQIRGNESPADFTRRVSRKVGSLLLVLLGFLPRENIGGENGVFVSYGSLNTVPKTEWLKTTELLIISQLWRVEI